MNSHIFRAYDIRGKAYDDITIDVCRDIGRAFGSIVREMYNLDHPRIAVGRDARTHSPEFYDAVIDGLQSTGCHCLLIDQTPSPVNYFTICDQKLDGGIQITASHNPGHDNGLKLQIRDAEAFAGDDIQTLRQRIESQNYLSGDGRAEEYNAIEPYTNHLTTLFGSSITDNLSVVVDSGNGVAGPCYCDVLRRVGCTVQELYTEPDGTFPNHPADPSKWDTLKDLQNEVLETNAVCGLAFDGDGDRLGIVDETGQIRTADEILLLLAQDHLTRHAGAPVISTVSNSSLLETEIEKWGGNAVMCSVGHSFVEHTMREHGAQLGGEQSGHFFCGEGYFSFDDAMVAGLWILKILSTSGESLSEMFQAFPRVYQEPEWRPHCDDAKKQDVIDRVTEHFATDYSVNTLDGVRIDFGDGAWAGIRKSNTSPCISICLEARSAEKLAEIKEIVYGHLAEYEEIG